MTKQLNLILLETQFQESGDLFLLIREGFILELGLAGSLQFQKEKKLKRIIQLRSKCQMERKKCAYNHILKY